MIHDNLDNSLTNKKIPLEYEERFKNAFQNLYGKLFNYTLYYLKSEDEARETVQEIFVKVWENGERLLTEDIDGLLFTMARNRCFDKIKHRRVKRRYEEHESDASSSLALCTLRDNSSLDLLVSKDTEKAIRNALNALPKSIRETFLMNRFNNMTYKEIAQNLGISEKTVEYRISCALRELRKKLSPYAFFVLLFYMDGING